MNLSYLKVMHRNDGFGEENTSSLEQKMKNTFASKLISVTDDNGGSSGGEGDITFTPEQIAAQKTKDAELESKRLALEQEEANKNKDKDKDRKNPLLDFGKDNNDGKSGNDNDDNKGSGSSDNDGEQHAVSYLMSKHGYNTDEYKEMFKDIDLDSDDIEEIEKFHAVKETIITQKAIQEYLQSKPELSDLAAHLEEGRSLDTWKEKVKSFNWKGFEIEEADVETQENVYAHLLKSRGLDDDEIADQIELAKDKKVLFAKATDAQSKLDVIEKQRIKEIQDREAASIQAERAAEAKIVKEVETTVLSGNINGYVLPEKNRKELLQYITSGERERKYDRLPLAAKILVDEIVRNYDEKEGKFNIKGLEVVKAPTRQVNVGGKKPNLNNSGKSGEDAETIKSTDLKNYRPSFQTFDS